MTVYADVVGLVNFGVDFCLLLGSCRLSGYPIQWRRIVMAAGIGGIYGMMCAFPRLFFLGNGIWCIVFLLIVGSVAFGVSAGAIRRIMLFLLLSMALGGIMLGIGINKNYLLFSTVALCGLCFTYRLGGYKAERFVRVQIVFQNKKVDLVALRDTGNNLIDPLTGRSVLIIGGKIARELTGLSKSQLSRPADTLLLDSMNGFRLIPYRSVGVKEGMLLAVRVNGVRIGNETGNALVAFTADELSPDGEYQALAGGI